MAALSSSSAAELRKISRLSAIARGMPEEIRRRKGGGRRRLEEESGGGGGDSSESSSPPSRAENRVEREIGRAHV